MKHKTPPPKSRYQEVLLALAMNKKKSLEGPEPTFDEIFDWHRGALSDQRAREVKAYVAHDADSYSIWINLLDSERLVRAMPQPSLLSRLRARLPDWSIATMSGGAAVTVMILFVAVVGINTIMSLTLEEQINRDYQSYAADADAGRWFAGQTYDKTFNNEPPSLQHAKQAARAGIHAGLTQLKKTGQLGNPAPWRAIIEHYPPRSEPCAKTTSPQRCQQRTKLMEQLGRWLALMQLNCLSTLHATNQQQRSTDFIDALASYEELAALRQALIRWRNETQGCGGVPPLMVKLED